MPPVLPDLPALLVRRVPRAPPGLLVLPDPLAQRVPPDLPALPGQPVLLDLLGLPVQLERRVPPALRAPPVPPALPAQRALPEPRVPLDRPVLPVDDASFDTNQVEEGSAITHTASTPTFTLGESGIYLISYSAVASNTTSTGTVGVELENNSTPVPGSESQATIATTSNVANLAATVLVNVTGTATITLASTENNVTLTEAAIVIQKLN